MHDLLRYRVVGRDNDAHAEPRQAVEMDGEGVRQADAAVRRRPPVTTPECSATPDMVSRCMNGIEAPP